MKILVAGVGNELRQDDGFGIALVRLAEQRAELEPNVILQEVGIGGIHLVQELHAGYDVLILADAVQWGSKAGTIHWRQMEELAPIEDMPVMEKRNFLADMHYTNPSRALMLARALDVLPPQVYILGCESAGNLDFEMGMSPEVEAALPEAYERLKHWIDHLSSAQDK